MGRNNSCVLASLAHEFKPLLGSSSLSEHHAKEKTVVCDEPYLAFMDRIAKDIILKSRTLLANQIDMITEGFKILSSICQGLQNYCSANVQFDSGFKSAMTVLPIRLLSSLQASFILVERGFSSDALDLCRSALESTYIWKYLILYPDEANSWFDCAFVDNKKFNFSRIVEVTNDNEIKEQYHRLCKHAHPTGMSFFHTIDIHRAPWKLAHQKECCAWILFVIQKFISEFLKNNFHVFVSNSFIVEYQKRLDIALKELWDEVLQYTHTSLKAFR